MANIANRPSSYVVYFLRHEYISKNLRQYGQNKVFKLLKASYVLKEKLATKGFSSLSLDIVYYFQEFHITIDVIYDQIRINQKSLYLRKVSNMFLSLK